MSTLQRFKRSILATSVILTCSSLTGCFSDDDDDPVVATPDTITTPEEPTTTTTFTVDVQAPDNLQTASLSTKIQNFFFNKAYAVDGEDLAAENFAVTVVDADGNVIEIVELTSDNINQNADGTWEIIVPGDPRFDCLIVVDINQPITLNVGDPLPANTIFAPTTEPDIEVDIASTIAFNEFLDAIPEGETFESFGLDIENPDDVLAVEAMVNNIQQSFEELVESQGIDINTLGSIDDAIAVTEALVEEIIAQEIENLENTDTTSTMASIFTSENGIYWFEGEYEAPWGYDIIEFGQLLSTGTETITEYRYDWFSQALTSESFTYEAGQEEEEFVLSSEGWQQSADFFQYVSADTEAGSILIADAAVSEYQISASASNITNLSERNIEELLSTYAQTQAFAQAVDSGAVFSDGAKLLRINANYVNDTYVLWHWPSTYLNSCLSYVDYTNEEGLGNGDCNLIYHAQAATETDSESSADGAVARTVFNNLLWQTNPTQVSDLYSEDVEYGTEGFVATSNGETELNVYFIQFVDNEEKTANYFKASWQSDDVTQIATGNWEEITLPNLTENATAIRLTHPDDYILERDFDDDERVLLIAHRDGYLRGGNFYAAGSIDTEGEEIFNAQAGMDIIDAIAEKHVNVWGLNDENACVLESEWDDTLYDGTGGPTTETAVTQKTFRRIANVCRGESIGGRTLSTNDLAGRSFQSDNEKYTFTDTTVTIEEFSDNTLTGDPIDSYPGLSWSISEGNLVIDASVDSGTDLVEGNVDVRMEYALIAVDDGSDSTSSDGAEQAETHWMLRGHWQSSLTYEIGPDGSATPELEANQGELYSETWTLID